MTRGMVPSRTPEQDKDRWRTPQAVFDMLDKRYGPFTLDAAADETNHKCDLWLGPGGLCLDALECSWGTAATHRVFCNPPYSLTAKFVEKALHEVLIARNIFSATLLVPATPDVHWFHQMVYAGYVPDPEFSPWCAGTRCEFSYGRIRFERPDGSKAGTPTHGSMFVTFSQEWL